jgi:cytochrome c-type biogenesis protein CcmH/NrfG
MSTPTTTLGEFLGFSESDLEQVRRIGHDLFAASNLADAAVIFRGMLDLEPSDVESITMLGVIRAQQGHTEQAEALLGDAIALDPGNVVALVARGEHRLARADPRAWGDLEAAIAADPEARLSSTRRAKELLGGRVAA